MMFLYPEYLLLGVAAVVFILGSNKKLHDYGLKSYGYMIAFFLLVLALMRPVVEQEPVTNEHYLHDVVIGVDLSFSMHAKDILPSRLGKAKELLNELVKGEVQSRYGVIGFSSNAIILSPMTQDGELLMHLFNSLDETQIMTKSSAIMPVLELARKLSKAKTVSVLLLSDGADEASYEKEAAFAKQNNLIVNVLMLATKTGGTLTLGSGELLKDENSHIVVTRENEAISLITRMSGGVYTKDFGTIRSALEEQKQEDYKTQTTLLQHRELFYYFVAAAIIVLLVSVTTLGQKIKKIFLPVLLLFGINLQGSVLESYYLQAAQNAYAREAYEDAAKLYVKSATPLGRYNAANSYYKAGLYEKALEIYATLRSSDPQFKAAIFYNIANTYVRLKEFEKAKAHYLKSLTLTYTKEADENYRYIKDVGEEMRMMSGRQDAKEKSQNAQEESSSAKNEKEGGSSNMEADAASKSGSSDMKAKTKTDPQFSTSQSQAKLSSKQYELINQRGVNEKKPW